MTEYRLSKVRQVHMLLDVYGGQILLAGDGEQETEHRLLAEFAVEDRFYAVLQSEAMKRDIEVAFFRIVPSEVEGEWELETIMDDEEWENVAELYDEMTVNFSDDV